MHEFEAAGRTTEALEAIANALLMGSDCSMTRNGDPIGSLTEAVVYVGDGLMAIAQAVRMQGHE